MIIIFYICFIWYECVLYDMWHVNKLFELELDKDRFCSGHTTAQPNCWQRQMDRHRNFAIRPEINRLHPLISTNMSAKFEDAIKGLFSIMFTRSKLVTHGHTHWQAEGTIETLRYPLYNVAMHCAGITRHVVTGQIPPATTTPDGLQLCEVPSPSKLPVKGNGPEKEFCHV